MGTSLRGRIILIVLLGAVFPLALLGFWVIGTAERSGEALLRRRLEASLNDITDDIGLRWLAVRGEILQLADLPVVQAGLKDANVPNHEPTPAFASSSSFQRALSDLRGTAVALRILDARGEVEWSGTTDRDSIPGAGPATTRVLPVELGIFDLGSGHKLGTLDVSVRLNTLLSETATWGAVAGSALGAFTPSGAALLPLPVDPLLLEGGRFRWRDETWLSVRRELRDPPLDIVLAAPVGPFAEPFRESARRNLWILGAVTVVVLGMATLLTRRTTRALGRLAEGAEAVSRGDLDRRVDAEGRDEVARVGRAFNAMTVSLRTTLKELSQRRALAAVGEFAASLAHEIRNPLTAVRLDLQRIQEEASESEETHELLSRTLRRIDRLDRSVTGALQVARSGTVERAPMDVRGPLRTAVQVARPAFEARGAVLDAREVEGEPVEVEGDAAALERLFLNLLLNAAQALERGERAIVEIKETAGEVAISIRDEGSGIDPSDLDRIFDPFFTTRPDGTGLGLPIARRIAEAHGGELAVESKPGAGTTVTLRLPRAATLGTAPGADARNETMGGSQ
ncbi:MAG: HAMP domain-containing protein [Gemmatimonadetes bacterium]|nr:HAMP domain-containing protein [Gemmatimonadota bacterium]